MSFWEGKKVIVTGDAGFLGSYVVQKLQKRGCKDTIVPRSKDYDLRREEAIIRLYEETHPDMVIHLAAKVGGIGANREKPGEFFYDNLIMGIQLIHSLILEEYYPFDPVRLSRLVWRRARFRDNHPDSDLQLLDSLERHG